MHLASRRDGMTVLFVGLFALGLIAGTAAGLLGIGGGILIVPALFELSSELGIPDRIAMHAAIATSLATIIPTSVISARGHHRRGAVDTTILRRWLPGLVVGIIIAGLIAGPIESRWLSAFFGIMTLAVGLYMFSRPEKLKERQGSGDGRPGKVTSSALATAVGGGSTLMGIGGGTLAVPIMTFYGIATHRAVGTAAAFGIAISVVGAAIFALTGSDAAGMPQFSLGFVYLPAALLIVAGTMIAAPFGVWLAHRLEAARLRRIFALFLAFVALRMIVAALNP